MNVLKVPLGGFRGKKLKEGVKHRVTSTKYPVTSNQHQDLLHLSLKSLLVLFE